MLLEPYFYTFPTSTFSLCSIRNTIYYQKNGAETKIDTYETNPKADASGHKSMVANSDNLFFRGKKLKVRVW